MGVKLSFPHEGKNEGLRILKNTVFGPEWETNWGLHNAVLCDQQVADYRILLIIIEDNEKARGGDGEDFFFLVGKPVGKRPRGGRL